MNEWQKGYAHARDISIKGEENMLEEIARLKTVNARLRAVLLELLEHGACYPSAIELGFDIDGEEWEERARAALVHDNL